MSDTLKNTRRCIAEEGVSELSALEDHPAALEIWQKLQILRKNKYDAVKDAISNASEPFDIKIAELEEEYALLLRLAL